MRSLSLILLCAALLGLSAGAALAEPPTQASAEAAFAQGKFDDARKTYERLVRSDPRPLGPRLGLIQTLLRLDQWRGALREAQGAAGADPASADARGLLALAEMRAGQPDAASTDSKRALVLDKNNYWGLVAAGRLADWNGRRKESRDFFTRATTLHPDRPDAWLGLWDDADENRLGEADLAVAKRYLALDPKGQPFDGETPFLRNLVDRESAFWRGFDADPAFHLSEADKKQEAYSAVFPIQRQGDYVMVSVKVNGQPFRLLFDTGAGGLLLTRKAARRLALPDLAKSLVSGLQGSAPASLQRADTLSLGPITFHSVPVTVADGPDMGDGLFGGSILEDYAVTLDFDNGTMTLARGPRAAHIARPNSTTSTVPLHLFHGDLFVSAHARDLDGNAPDRPLWVLLDTGAETNFLSLALTHDLSAHTPRAGWTEGTTEGRSGIGDSAMRYDYCLTPARAKITFDGTDHVLNQIGLNGESDLDRQLSPGANFETGMLMGIPVLSQHNRITIDYPHRLLTLEDPK